MPNIALYKLADTSHYFSSFVFTSPLAMNSLQNLGSGASKHLHLLPDLVAFGVAVSTGFMLGTGASRREGIFSVLTPLSFSSYLLIGVQLQRHLSPRSIPNPLDIVEGGSDVGSKIVTAVKGKATEAVDVINKAMPQIKLGSAYGCWKMADQETCLYYPMFLYAAAFGAACIVLSSVLHYSMREGSRRRPLFRTLSLMCRTLACALFSVCLVGVIHEGEFFEDFE